MKYYANFFVWLLIFVIVSPSYAASPEGIWTTFDDKTGQRRAVVSLTLTKNILNGTIVSVFPQLGDTGRCSLCPDEFKDKPVAGLKFLWGLEDSGDNVWEGGHILDAKTGKIYRAMLRVKGDKLYVRGYVGIPLLGRTQIWVH